MTSDAAGVSKLWGSATYGGPSQQLAELGVPNQSSTCSHLSGRMSHLGPQYTNLAMIGYPDGRIRFFDIQHCMPVSEFQAHQCAVQALCVRPHDSVLISGDMEGTIRLHKVADCTQLEAFKTGSNSQVCSLVTSPRPDSLNVFAFSLRNGDCFVVRYDVGADVDVVDSFHMRDEEEETTSGDTLVCFSPCEDNVVLVSSPWSNECILVRDFESRTVLRSLEVLSVPTCLDISPHGFLVAMGTTDGLLRLVDYEAGTFQDFDGVSAGQFTRVGFSADGKNLICSSRREILQWMVTCPA